MKRSTRLSAGSPDSSVNTQTSDGRARAVTLSDVARLAGVSPQTVSRVLNGGPYVAAATRQRVEEAVAQLRYRPNASARALVTRRTMNLGVISVGHSQWGPSVALFGIAEAAREAGYATSVVSLGTEINQQTMRAAFDHLTAVAVDGIVVIAPVEAAVVSAEGVSADSADVPVVFFEPGADNGTTIVAIDEVLGARCATRHLLELGHETVWHVSGPDGWLGTEARVRGWHAELAAAGVVTHEVLVGDWSSASGYEAGKALARNRDITAVFVANDQMALGVLKALRESGRDVPGDVSVVGFDDLPEAAFFQPSLTTVHMDFTEVGRRCVERLLAMIRGQTLAPEPAVQPHLIVRATTAPLP